MTLNFRLNIIATLCVVLSILGSGCASNKALEAEVEGSLSTNTVPAVASATNSIMSTTSSVIPTPCVAPTHEVTNGVVKISALPPKITPPPPASAKPWKLVLEHGSQRALVDNVLVYLSAPAMINRETKKPQASITDYRYMLSPLLNAQTNAIAPERALRVFIDPGHGGADPGAISHDSKTFESRLTLDLAKRLAKHLKNAGFEVMLSRSDNVLTQVLEERPLKASRWKADIFLSIHFNANPSTSARGFETYILPAHGMLSTSADNPSPASRAQANIRENGNANDIRNMQLGFAIQRRTLKSTKLEDRGLRRARFVVLREAKMPAVLIECGFLSSPKDLKFIRTAEGQEKLARGIYEGICDYAFGTMAPGLPPHPLKVSAVKPSTILPSTLQTHAQTLKPPATAITPAATGEVINVATPTWKPEPLIDDPNEDPRIRQIRKDAAAAAGL